MKQKDPKYESILNSLKKEIVNLDTILNDPEYVVYEEISELKRKVDLDRETTKSQIDELADEFIQKLESYQKKFRAECKANIGLEHYKALIAASKKQLSEYEKCLSLVENKEKDTKSKENEDLINNLQLAIK